MYSHQTVIDKLIKLNERIAVYLTNDEGKEKETNELIQHYLNIAKQTNVWDAQVKFCGDVMFGVPVHLSLSTIAAKSKNTNLYSYVFSYVPEGGAHFLGSPVGAAHGLGKFT